MWYRRPGLGYTFPSRALGGEPLTIYGNGKQVRDILFVDDLVDAMLLACQRIDELTGGVFNIGGVNERHQLVESF